MKPNKKLMLSAFCMVMAASLLLAGGIMAIAEYPTESKPFESDGMENIAVDTDAALEETPVPQTALQTKFGAYIHEEENGARAVLFSDEQIAELLAVREAGKRNPLPYDEVLFLINDSARLYHAYDEIVLDSALVERLGLSDYLIGFDGTVKTAEAPETDYADYAKMVREIYCITVYRLYLHDAGLICMTTGVYSPNPGEHTFHFVFEGDGMLQDEHFFPAKNLFLLPIDGGTEIGEAYNDMLCNAYQSHCAEHIQTGAIPQIGFDGSAMEAPMLIIDMPDDNKYAHAFQIEIAEIRAETRGILYPTVELEAAKPEGYFDRVYSFPYEEIVIAKLFPAEDSPALTESEKAELLAVMDCGREWVRTEDFSYTIEARFTLEGEYAVNYSDGVLYSTDGKQLNLTDKERAVVEALIEKYVK